MFWERKWRWTDPHLHVNLSWITSVVLVVQGFRVMRGCSMCPRWEAALLRPARGNRYGSSALQGCRALPSLLCIRVLLADSHLRSIIIGHLMVDLVLSYNDKV